MKAILAFAFLVIAAQASTPAYFLGFTEQIGLNNEQMKHGQVCFESFRKVAMDVHRLIKSKEVGISEALRAAIELFDDVEHKLKIDCSVYMNDIMYTLLGNTQGNLEEVAKKNWNTYAVELIQQYAMYFDAIMARNDYEAGRIEAYIYQILLGLEKPKVLPLPEFNSTRFVRMDVTKYVTEFTQSYYETLGLYDNKGIKTNIECNLAQYELNTLVPTLDFEFRYANTTANKLKLIEKLINGFIRLSESCVDAYKFNFQHILLPIIGAFEVAPVHATLAVVHNVALNLPEMKQNTLQMIVDLSEGRYSEAGKLNAELLITLFSKIYAH